jgi:hypothetical protein
MDAWEKDPASKPKYDNSSKNRKLSDTIKIFSTRSSEPRRVFDTCSYCHGNKKNIFVGFKGGDAYADYALPFLLSDPIPANDLQGEFWPDGRTASTGRRHLRSAAVSRPVRSRARTATSRTARATSSR